VKTIQQHAYRAISAIHTVSHQRHPHLATGEPPAAHHRALSHARLHPQLRSPASNNPSITASSTTSRNQVDRENVRTEVKEI